MPKPRAGKLETPTARRKLAVRKKPYWTHDQPGHPSRLQTQRRGRHMVGPRCGRWR